MAYCFFGGGDNCDICEGNDCFFWVETDKDASRLAEVYDIPKELIMKKLESEGFMNKPVD